jgi:hypothetical protein
MIFIADRASGELRNQGGYREQHAGGDDGRHQSNGQTARLSTSTRRYASPVRRSPGRSWTDSVGTDVMGQARPSLQAIVMAAVKAAVIS